MASILLGVSGSAACFKAAALASALTKAGHKVQVVMTAAAVEFVGPLQFSCLTGSAALVDEFDAADPSGMDHISLARAADLMIIVPATANTLGILACGLAPNLLGSLALAFEASKPRLFVPAMNPEMWSNPAVQRNAATLLSDGWLQVGPAEGDTACGEVGSGRMVEVDQVQAAISAALQS
jgi:phosphopantothenoylcysteine decarboxylase/phosphopantothenate--cysteine ligase